MEARMQSQVLALVTAKNAVLAHATAAQLVAAARINKKQSQHNCKGMLMKEFTDDLGGGSMGRAIAKKRIERYR
jgi:hypothetical protein